MSLEQKPTFLEGVEAGDVVKLPVTADMAWIDVRRVRECVDKGRSAEEIFKGWG